MTEQLAKPIFLRFYLEYKAGEVTRKSMTIEMQASVVSKPVVPGDSKTTQGYD
jgi:hypothetical protein